MTLLEALLRYALACAIAGFIMLFAGIPIPRSIVRYDKFPYKLLPFEERGNFFRLIKVHAWKTRIPDASKVVSRMTRKALPPAVDVAGIDLLIRETCIAESVHMALMLLTPVYSIGIPLRYAVLFSLLYILGNFPYVIVQRYNRPRLIQAMELMKKRQARQARKKKA